MGTPQSPSRMFNGLDEDLYDNAKFAHDINDKMRVPKRIKATGEFSDEDRLLSNQNGIMNSWNYHDKIDMIVPDRIVVLGHNQHLEEKTRATPREIQLENSILPPNPPTDIYRVQTPPRVLTLNDHHFPTASEDSSPHRLPGYGDDYDDEIIDEEDDVFGHGRRTTHHVRANGFAHATVGFKTAGENNSVESDSQYMGPDAGKRSQHDASILTFREATPMGELTPSEEVRYLRRQLAKLNRRVLNIEISNEQRMQREKIVYCLGLAYFVLKTILWLNRGNTEAFSTPLPFGWG